MGTAQVPGASPLITAHVGAPGIIQQTVWSAMLVSRVEGMGLIDSLFSGYKFLPKSWRNRDD